MLVMVYLVCTPSSELYSMFTMRLKRQVAKTWLKVIRSFGRNSTTC